MFDMRFMQQFQQQQQRQPSQLEIARARSAQMPRGGQQGNMAGCDTGCPMPAPGPFPVGGIGPEITTQMTVLPVIIKDLVGGEETCMEVVCTGRLFWGCAVASLNSPREVLLTSAKAGGVFDLICGAIDLGLWNRDQCWCPFDWKCISSVSPLELCFEPFSTLSEDQVVNLYLGGNSVYNVGACYPGFGGGGGGGGGGAIGQQYANLVLPPGSGAAG